MSKQQDIYAAWAADGRAWRAAQDAWAHWLDALVEKKTQHPEREAGGKWLYLLWIEEWHVFHDSVPWENLGEEIREHYRRLWDRINEGFAARSH